MKTTHRQTTAIAIVVSLLAISTAGFVYADDIAAAIAPKPIEYPADCNLIAVVGEGAIFVDSFNGGKKSKALVLVENVGVFHCPDGKFFYKG